MDKRQGDDVFEDGLLEELGRVAREEDSRGSSAPQPQDDDPFGAALPPLGKDFEARVVRQIQELQSRERSRSSESGKSDGSNAEALDDTVPPVRRPSVEAPELRRSRSRRRSSPARWLALAALLLASLGLVWVLRSGFLSGSGSGANLPVYVVELEGQMKSMRSPDAATDDALPTFVVGSRFELVLRPRPIAEAASDWQLAFYLADADGELRRWDIGYRRSPGSAVKIEGRLGQDLEISPGSFTFLFLYGVPGRLPEPRTLSEVEGAGADGAGGDWRAVRVPFRVVPAMSGGAGGDTESLEGDELSLQLPLEVRFAGCYAVSPGPRCVPYSEITLWVRTAPEASLELRLGGRPVETRLKTSSVAVDGGRRFVVPVGAEDGEIEVLASMAGRSARFHLELTSSTEPTWFRGARRLAYAGDVVAAREQLEAGLDAAEPELRGSILSLLGRLDETEAQKVERLEAAVVLHRRSGRLLELASDLGMLQSIDLHRRRFGQLRERLDEIAADLEVQDQAAVPAEASVLLAYYRGILESDVGNFRGALESLRFAVNLARRLRLTKEWAVAEAELGLVLQRLGRGAEAVEHFKILDDPAFASVLSACEWARIHNNHAWVLILADGQLGDPLRPLERAMRLDENGACGEELRLDLWLNRALAFELEGQRFEARRALAEVEALGAKANALQRLWWEDAEGRLALDDGQGEEALEHYRRLEDLAERAAEPRGRWRAKVQQAAAHELLGNSAQALDAYSAAEELLDGQSLEVPLDAGRQSFLADRDAGARRHLDLLLRLGRPGDAFEVARRSRSRMLRSIRRGHRLAHFSADEQARWDLEIARYLKVRAMAEVVATEDWQLTESQRAEVAASQGKLRASARRALDRAFQVFGHDRVTSPPPLEPGVLVLTFHPLPEGWVAFAATSEKVETHRLELEPAVLGDPAELAHRLLEPFDDAIEGATRIRVLAYGALENVDFHALPWRGDVLLAARPVVYGLDLDSPAAGLASASGLPGGAKRRALVIGDARGDLPAARREADLVQEALRESFEVTRLEAEAATLAEIRQRLARVDLVHVAGHGVVAGEFGWESALLLAGEGRLTLGDVLALERAPSRVILSSCESARTATSSLAGLGLAQAFLVAGADDVIAALRPVGDRDTEVLFERLYRTTLDPAADLGERLRQAQLAWHTDDAAADWASFRVLEP